MTLVDLALLGVGLTVAIAIWSSFTTVPEGEVRALVVFGEVRQILEPGRYIVPPFVSAAYPIDLGTKQYVTSGGRRSVPAEFRDHLELIESDRAKADRKRR